MSSTDPLLQPLKLKNLILKNRVMSTSHACGLEKNGMPDIEYQMYHEEKARGGIGLTMFGGSSNVDVDSPNLFRQLDVGTDEIIPYFQSFSERIHRLGAALMIQITHLGRHSDHFSGHWLPAIGPSATRDTYKRVMPKIMDEHDIERVIKAFAKAARRCEEGGLDGLEVIASGQLIGQFLSPAVNRRTDGYGGSLKNRCQFGLRVLEAIRENVSDRFIVGIRWTVDEGSEGWLSGEEGIEAAQIFEQSGTIDFFNAIYGRIDTERGLAYDSMPAMPSPIAPFLVPIARFKKEVSLPVFHAARISDIATARHAIREGILDLVGMTRAHIADPHIVRKIEAKEEDRIRPCVGASQCQTPNYRPHCIHNPTTGRETQMTHAIARAEKPGKTAVVVGGGPGGLEAARVLSARGHRVILFEATDQLGGQIVLASRASWRKDIVGIVEWRAAELQRAGVEIRFNTYAEMADILAENPDIVIIATGGLPMPEWPGAELCVSSWDVIGMTAPIAENVLVFDGTGRHPAPQVAELVAQKGKKVQLISVDAHIAQEQSYVERVAWKRRMYEHRIPMLFDHELIGVHRDGNKLVTSIRNLTDDRTFERTVDQVIYEIATVPVDDVFQDLRAHSANDGGTDPYALINFDPQPALPGRDGFQLFRVGDAVASRNIHTAIYDALRLCRTL